MVFGFFFLSLCYAFFCLVCLQIIFVLSARDEDPKFFLPNPDPAQLNKKTLVRNEKKNIYILGR